MWRLAKCVLLAVTFGMVTTSVANAQKPSSDSAMRIRQASPVVRWVTKPTAITLARDQRQKLDSINAMYAADTMHDQAQAKGQSDIAQVQRILELTTKYQNMVRAILNPAQQAVFDKNIRMATCCE